MVAVVKLSLIVYFAQIVAKRLYYIGNFVEICLEDCLTKHTCDIFLLEVVDGKQLTALWWFAIIVVTFSRGQLWQ